MPAYNSAAFIDEVITNLLHVIQGFECIKEIIIVNDCSNDDTWQRLILLKKKNPVIKIVNLSKNYGQQNATMCGVGLCNQNFVFTLDDDYLYTKNDFETLINCLTNSSADAVYAHFTDLKKSNLKKIGSNAWKSIVKQHNKHKSELGTSIRLFKRDLISSGLSEIYIQNVDEQIDWNTNYKEHIQLENKLSRRKHSSYKGTNLFKEVYNHIFGFSTIPLRYITAIGFIFASISFLVGSFYLYQKFFLKVKVLGFTSLIVSVTFSTGLILIGIGTLAQYIGTIINLQMKRSGFHIKEIL